MVLVLRGERIKIKIYCMILPHSSL
jgi:hypothetical protein